MFASFLQEYIIVGGGARNDFEKMLDAIVAARKAKIGLYNA